jgi:transposase-like protein
MSQMALALRVNEVAEPLGMGSHDESATVSPLLRARSSGRFQRTTVARWRERLGVPSRVGRPSAVTPELAEAGLRLLREGVTVAVMVERIGVDKRSWYRWVHQQARDQVQVRTYRRTQRHPHSIRADLVRQMVALDKQGLARVLIAERLGLHINTVVKYLLRQGRPRKC